MKHFGRKPLSQNISDVNITLDAILILSWCRSDIGCGVTVARVILELEFRGSRCVEFEEV